jgi:very-short-patch-repair endonuclease
VGERRLERAVAEAERRGLTHSEQLRTLLAAYPRRAGTRRLRNLIDRRAGPAFTRSELEDRVLALVRRAGLEPPEVNQVVEGFEVDLYWPDSRLAVEVDGFAYHSSPGVFESDRQRDSVLAAAGIRVMRVTWRQLDENPEALLVNLVRALSR